MNKEFKCPYCKREYSKQGCYEKHKIVCEIINTDKDNKTLGLNQLSLIVIDLVKSNNKLQKEVVELKKWIQTKKQKFNVLEWLNNNYIPSINFNKLLKEIEIGREELEIIFKSNNIQGITEILQNIIKTKDYNLFKSFDQKENTIYVFKEKWEILSSREFDELFSLLWKKILHEFKKWQDENDSILYTEKFSVIYINNVKKIMGGKESFEKQKSIIHRNLYKFLKQNIQNVVEYEFS